MTTINSSKIFYDGVFADVTVTVAANTTLDEGLILGRNKDDELVGFTTDNNVAATESTAAFTTEPIYILAETLKNTTSSKATFKARVFDGGVVNQDKIIFLKAADKANVKVLDQLHLNGYTLVPVQELTEQFMVLTASH